MISTVTIFSVTGRGAKGDKYRTVPCERDEWFEEPDDLDGVLAARSACLAAATDPG